MKKITKKKAVKKKAVKKISSKIQLKNFKHNVLYFVNELQSEVEEARESLYAEPLTMEKVCKATMHLSNIADMICDHYLAQRENILCNKKYHANKI